MDSSLILDRAALPSFSRLDEWFGMALIEPSRGMRMFEHFGGMARDGALAAHITSNLNHRAVMSPADRKTEREARRMYEARIMTVAMDDGGDSVAVGKRPDGEAYRCAVIDLAGTLMKSPSSMDEATSTVDARERIRAAASDDQIDAIMLRIDSPGGYVAGTEDLAAQIRMAASKKPMAAYVEDLCASAAYWAASAAPKIYANNSTCEIGSIGVLMAFYEATGMAGQMGLKPVVIATGKFKATGFPGTEITADQRAMLQSKVDGTMDEFVRVVSEGRKMSAERVRTLATGEVYSAKDAQASGLIDGIKSFDEVLALLAGAAMKQQANQQKNHGAGSGSRMATDAPQSTPVDPANKEVHMDTPPTNAPAVQTQGQAASLKELKAKLPNSTAEFREQCIEKGMSIEQAALALVGEQANQLEDAREKAKKIGVPAIVTRGAAIVGNQTAKRTLMTRASEIQKEERCTREDAWKKACAENPELRRDMVVAHNLKNGRKAQAAKFADEFEETVAPSEE